jgi:hypothetical protein
LVEAAIKSRFIKTAPKRMIGDKAYDSDPVDQRLLKEHGTELIAPHKANRKKPKTQDDDSRMYQVGISFIGSKQETDSFAVKLIKLYHHRKHNFIVKVAA